MTTITTIKRVAAFCILVLVLIGSLSSFKKSDAIKVKQAQSLAAAAPRIFILQYWNGDYWQNDPVAECGGNGAICSGSYVTRGAGDPIAILNNAKSQYLASGYLSNTSINSANIVVGNVTVTITERSAD